MVYVRLTENLHDVPLDDARWNWGEAHPVATEHLGRSCIALETPIATVGEVELENGVIEVDLAVGAARGFHGVVWRHSDDENFESFFVRPHQMGNPDAVQYTPVFNGLSAWQLHHGPGYWAPLTFPLGEWFTIRVAFDGSRAEAFVGEVDEPSLVVAELKHSVAPGRIGIMAGSPPIHVGRFAYGKEVSLGAPGSPPPPAPDGVVTGWQVSDPFPEALLDGANVLPDALTAGRSWTELAAEPAGLADLARVNGIRDGRNTVLARARLTAERDEVRALELGFSDRAVVFLNGRALYRGDDTYRSRDYRFLGSIGYYDTLFLPLMAGDNELVVAVSEDFGGWGVQARLVSDVSRTPG
jgi:hypothetical protein